MSLAHVRWHAGTNFTASGRVVCQHEGSKLVPRDPWRAPLWEILWIGDSTRNETFWDIPMLYTDDLSDYDYSVSVWSCS